MSCRFVSTNLSMGNQLTEVMRDEGNVKTSQHGQHQLEGCMHQRIEFCFVFTQTLSSVSRSHPARQAVSFNLVTEDNEPTVCPARALCWLEHNIFALPHARTILSKGLHYDLGRCSRRKVEACKNDTLYSTISIKVLAFRGT